MSATINRTKLGKINGVGDIAVYNIVLSGGDTSFTITDTYFTTVYSNSWSSATNSAAQYVYFDGTNIKGAGFTANDTVNVTVIGN